MMSKLGGAKGGGKGDPSRILAEIRQETTEFQQQLATDQAAAGTPMSCS